MVHVYVHMYMQSHVEIEDYSTVYLDCITMFKMAVSLNFH